MPGRTDHAATAAYNSNLFVVRGTLLLRVKELPPINHSFTIIRQKNGKK